jgi:sporulation-control protein spo0M
MFNKILSFFSGKHIAINTQFSKQRISAGDRLAGVVLIRNLSEQETLLKNIKISLVSSFQRQTNVQIEKENYLIFNALLRDKLVIFGKESCEMPFDFLVPLYMPVLPATAIVKTEISYAGLQTATDHDELIILPTLQVQNLFDAFWELGFKHTPLSGYVEKHAQQPLQIFSMKPIKEPYLGKCKDIEFFFETTAKGLEIFMTIDKTIKEFLAVTVENGEENASKIKFSIANNETIDTILLAHYINSALHLLTKKR